MKAKYLLTDRQFITNDNGMTKINKNRNKNENRKSIKYILRRKLPIFDKDSNTYIQYGGVYRINKGRN